MRTLQTEFPDYGEDLPELKPFTLQPWHNDTCPKYEWTGVSGEFREVIISVWVDYPDKVDRENPEEPRYMVGIETEIAHLMELGAETLPELVEKANQWYLESVGLRIDEGDPDISQGDQLLRYAQMVYLKSCGFDPPAFEVSDPDPEPETDPTILVARVFSALLEATLSLQEMKQVILQNRADPKHCASHQFCDPNMVMYKAMTCVYPKLNLDPGWTEVYLPIMNEAWAVAQFNEFWVKF